MHTDVNTRPVVVAQSKPSSACIECLDPIASRIVSSGLQSLGMLRVYTACEVSCVAVPTFTGLTQEGELSVFLCVCVSVCVFVSLYVLKGLGCGLTRFRVSWQLAPCSTNIPATRKLPPHNRVCANCCERHCCHYTV